MKSNVGAIHHYSGILNISHLRALIKLYKLNQILILFNQFNPLKLWQNLNMSRKKATFNGFEGYLYLLQVFLRSKLFSESFKWLYFQMTTLPVF